MQWDSNPPVGHIHRCSDHHKLHPTIFATFVLKPTNANKNLYFIKRFGVRNPEQGFSQNRRETGDNFESFRIAMNEFI